MSLSLLPTRTVLIGDHMDLATLWTMLHPVLAGQLRHILTVAAGVLIAKGALQSDQSGAFVQIGVGLATWAVGAGWSWWQKEGQLRMVAMLAKMKPVASPGATEGQAVKAAIDATK